ncbi:hypothetical protein I302_107011 [Kwoniella bestiolae CBS 10118]|uniref:Uncharacterized protein n=1 Tax=Kwoniella bestiolae CBS 10118 TaxID=1296100 RepID=A0A1B9FZS2_9TREE|nr:hypothetical protein I302_05725 [Kwoniella bestiolae CBS 10118]OCF24266.1 hypothetical protein I302_05725 [Kwoniella bestiolae CBS 10118]
MSTSGGTPTFTIEVNVPPLHQVLTELSESTLDSTYFERSEKRTSDKCRIFFFQPLSFRTQASVHCTDHEGASGSSEILSTKFDIIPRSTIALARDSKLPTKATLSSAITIGNQVEATEVSSPKWPATIQYQFTTREEFDKIDDFPHVFPFDYKSSKIKLGLKNLNLKLYDDENNVQLHDSHTATLFEGDITVGLEDQGDIQSVKRSLVDKSKGRLPKKRCDLIVISEAVVWHDLARAQVK